MRTTTNAIVRRVSRRGLVAGSIGVSAAAVAAMPAQCRGRIYPGVSVAGVDVSGMSLQDAESLVRERLAAFERHAVTFRYDDREWTASLDDLRADVDYGSMLTSAMRSVRSEGALQRYVAIIGDAPGREVPLFLRWRQDALETFLDSIAGDLFHPPHDARLMRHATDVLIEPHRYGRRLDIDQARDDAKRVMLTGLPGVVDLQVIEIAPAVFDTDLDGARERALSLVSEPLVFMLGEREYYVSVEDLTAALIIDEHTTARLDGSAIGDRIDEIEHDVSRAPRNVMLGWDGRPYVIENDIPGQELDREALLGLIESLTDGDDRIADLPVRVVPAAARADNIGVLGIHDLIGYGASSFVGSSYERAINVEVSASNLSYKLVAPGEEFSFNELLGPITEEYGYIAGSIISGDFAATDIGGGVCQVSTTVFRAALNAGFRFSEWNPHSWRLAFYEADGSSPGLDAAIYQPNSEWEGELDLRFINPLESWLLLVMVVEGETVSAHFFGRDPRWTVDLAPARISEPKLIPEPVEKLNAALAPGERRMVQQAQPGYTVRVRRTVTHADGTVLSDGDFVSDYVSQPEAWEVGPS